MLKTFYVVYQLDEELFRTENPLVAIDAALKLAEQFYGKQVFQFEKQIYDTTTGELMHVVIFYNEAWEKVVTNIYVRMEQVDRPSIIVVEMLIIRRIR